MKPFAIGLTSLLVCSALAAEARPLTPEEREALMPLDPERRAILQRWFEAESAPYMERFDEMYRSLQRDTFNLPEDQVERHFTLEGAVERYGRYMADLGDGYGEEVDGMRLVACRRSLNKPVLTHEFVAGVWLTDAGAAPPDRITAIRPAGGRVYYPLSPEFTFGQRVYPIVFPAPKNLEDVARIEADVRRGGKVSRLTLDIPMAQKEAYADYTPLCRLLKDAAARSPAAENGKVSVQGWWLRAKFMDTVTFPWMADRAGKPIVTPVRIAGDDTVLYGFAGSGMPAGKHGLVALNRLSGVPATIRLKHDAPAAPYVHEGPGLRLAVGYAPWSLTAQFNRFSARVSLAVRRLGGRIVVDFLPFEAREFLGIKGPVVAVYSRRYPLGLFWRGPASPTRLSRLLSMAGF